MKKLLSLMMLMLLCTSAWAETVTDVLNREFTGVTENSTKYNDWSGKKSNSDAVYAGNSAGSYNSIQLRQQSPSGIVTTTSGGKVKEVVLTFEGNTGTSRYVCIYGKNSAYSSPAELYNDDTKGTLLGEIARSTDPIKLTVNGDYQYIGICSKSGALYLSEIKITWEKVIPPAVATPVITFDPVAPYQGDNVTCTITCATEGASIQYSTDGENYNDYPADGFTLTENTTVYAKATLGEDESEVASKAIEFTPITTVANIAALTALENGKVFRMTGSATVVYTYGNFVYIKDESGSTLLYDVTNGNPEVAAGYTISNLQGVVSIYNGLFEVGKPASYTVEQTTVSVDPVVMAVDAISSANVNQYVKLEGVSLSEITNNYFEINGTLTGRNRFAVDYPTEVAEKSFDVTGFVGINGETLQFWPTDIEDVTPEPPAVFGIKVTPTPAEGQVFTAPVNVTIELLNATGEEAYFDYYLDDVKQKNYPEGGFTLYKTTAVKVVATNDDEDLTEVTWEGTYTINLPDFSIEPSVAPGTTLYKATDVTFTPKNGFGDLTISYKVNDSEEEITDAAFTVNVAENTTVTIEAVDGAGRVFNDEFTYTVDLFVPAKKFKLVTDLTELEAGKQVLIAGFVEDDVNMYVMGAQTNNNRAAVQYALGNDEVAPLATLDLANVTGYKSMVLGKDGDNYTFYDVENEGYLYAAGANSSNHLKVQGTLNDNGKAAITLVDGIFSVVFQGNSSRNHMRFNPSGDGLFSCYAETNSQEPVYIYIEGEVVIEKTATPEIVVTEGEEAYTVTATGAGTVKLYKDGEEVVNPYTVARTSEEQTFVFTATAQEEGKDISEVATQNVTVPALPATTYTITLDKEPGDYTALVNVKATVEPALPEGATLTFKINDADPKEYNPEKGVNMLESGTLTFTATDAAGNVLATTSAEYKYIMGVFGDLNNDGTVDVTEVGIIVNLILGKLNN